MITIQQVAVPHDRHQGRAQGRLVRQQQADDTEIGQLAGFRHAQSEGRAGGGLGQTRTAQANPAQQRLRIQPEVCGDFEVIDQRRGPDQRGHGRVALARSAVNGPELTPVVTK